jgi:hypothetical protein
LTASDATLESVIADGAAFATVMTKLWVTLCPLSSAWTVTVNWCVGVLSSKSSLVVSATVIAPVEALTAKPPPEVSPISV